MRLLSIFQYFICVQHVSSVCVCASAVSLCVCRILLTVASLIYLRNMRRISKRDKTRDKCQCVEIVCVFLVLESTATISLLSLQGTAAHYDNFSPFIINIYAIK